MLVTGPAGRHGTFPGSSASRPVHSGLYCGGARRSEATIKRAVPYFICPNCRRRVIDSDRREGLSHQPVGCAACGFGFLFELLEDYYPGPNTAFVVCDAGRRIIAVGRGILELTGYRERELLGKTLSNAFHTEAANGDDPAAVAARMGRPPPRPAAHHPHALGHPARGHRRLLPRLRRGRRPPGRALAATGMTSSAGEPGVSQRGCGTMRM